MALVHDVSKKNLRKLAWKSGYEGVTGLAVKLGRSRVTLHRAVRNPHRYGPTMALLRKHLLPKANPQP